MYLFVVVVVVVQIRLTADRGLDTMIKYGKNSFKEQVNARTYPVPSDCEILRTIPRAAQQRGRAAKQRDQTMVDNFEFPCNSMENLISI